MAARHSSQKSPYDSLLKKVSFGLKFCTRVQENTISNKAWCLFRLSLQHYLYLFLGDFFQLLFACCQENVFSVERFQRSAEQGTGRVSINSIRRGSRGKTTTTPDFMWNITWLDFFKVYTILLFDEFKLFSLFPSYRGRGFFITSNLIHWTRS